jgi:Tol biopolymer transport system component
VLNDAYPNRDNHRTLMLYRPEDDTRVDVGEFYTMPELGGEIRCDLHPRWSRDGTKICFDSTHEGERQVYVMDVADIVNS